MYLNKFIIKNLFKMFFLYFYNKTTAMLLVKRLFFVKILFLLLFLNATVTFSANKIDSLKSIIVSNKEDTLMVQSYIELVKYYTLRNQDSAIVFANNVLVFIKNNDLSQYSATVNLTVGNMFFVQGNYGRAMEYYYSLLKFYDNGKGTNKELIVPYFNIALVYDKLRDNIHAREYYNKAVKLADEIMIEDSTYASHFSVGRIYNNIGITYQNEKEYDKALEYYHKALTISDKYDNKEALPYVYNNIGLVYQSMNDYEIALTFFEKSLQIRLEKNDLQGIALTYFYFGNCYNLMGDNNKSLEFLQKAYDIAKQNNYLELQKDIAKKMIKVYAKQNNYEKAYQLYKVYDILTDSLNYAESSKTAIILEQQYKFDKITREYELKRQKILYRNIIIGGLLFAMLIFISLLFFLARSKVKRIQLQRAKLSLEKEKLQGELEYKNKELTTNVMYLLRKNELINNISLKLLELKSDLLKANQSPVQRIINELQNSVNDDAWKEFEYRFKDVHEDFYKALNKKFPDLTNNERKLCAFLRLNMSTKEISAITFQSVHSITIARSRLRKKLNITHSDISLTEFLLSIDGSNEKNESKS
jgi:tetratricopeptide (TPR) repeat protein